MEYFYSKTSRRYLDVDYYGLAQKWISKKEMQSLIDSGKVIKLKNTIYLGLDSEFLYMTLDNICLRMFGTDCDEETSIIGYYYFESNGCNAVVTITRRMLIKESDEDIICEACERNVNYKVIFRVLDAWFPYHASGVGGLPWEPGSPWSFPDDYFCANEPEKLDAMGMEIYQFMKKVVNMKENLDDNGKCYYELKCSEMRYPSFETAEQLLAKADK